MRSIRAEDTLFSWFLTVECRALSLKYAEQGRYHLSNMCFFLILFSFVACCTWCISSSSSHLRDSYILGTLVLRNSHLFPSTSRDILNIGHNLLMGAAEGTASPASWSNHLTDWGLTFPPEIIELMVGLCQDSLTPLRSLLVCLSAGCSLIYSHPTSSLPHSSFCALRCLSLSVSLVTLVIHSLSPSVFVGISTRWSRSLTASLRRRTCPRCVLRATRSRSSQQNCFIARFVSWGSRRVGMRGA